MCRPAAHPSSDPTVADVEEAGSHDRNDHITRWIALGARRGDVPRMIVGQGFRIAAIGALAGRAGLAHAAAATRLMSGLLFGVNPLDAATFAATGFLALVAFVASYLPARRAARADPMRVLREE